MGRRGRVEASRCSSHLQIRLLPRVVTAQRYLQVGLPSQIPSCSPPSGRTSQRCSGGAERVWPAPSILNGNGYGYATIMRALTMLRDTKCDYGSPWFMGWQVDTRGTNSSGNNTVV